MPNLIIKNGTGELVFSDTTTHFSTKNATLNSSPLYIDGDCDLFGKFDFNISTPKQNLNKTIADIRGNTLLKNFNTYIEQIENIKGFGDVNLNIYGDIKNINEIEFNKNIFTKGSIKLSAVTLKLKTIPQAISNIFGEINVENQDIILGALVTQGKMYSSAKKINSISFVVCVLTFTFDVLFSLK